MMGAGVRSTFEGGTHPIQKCIFFVLLKQGIVFNILEKTDDCGHSFHEIYYVPEDFEATSIEMHQSFQKFEHRLSCPKPYKVRKNYFNAN